MVVTNSKNKVKKKVAYRNQENKTKETEIKIKEPSSKEKIERKKIYKERKKMKFFFLQSYSDDIVLS